MSSWARWLIGTFSALAGVATYYSERTAPSKAPLVVFLFILFCFSIAIACFFSHLRGVALRVVAALVLLTTVYYMVYGVVVALHKPHPGEYRPSWLGGVLAFAVYGLPSFYVLVHGSYPDWGWGAKGFRHGDDADDLE
jgi:uncharacterized membrane protein YfcA